jgi:hypothetical protein
VPFCAPCARSLLNVRGARYALSLGAHHGRSGRHRDARFAVLTRGASASKSCWRWSATAVGITLDTCSRLSRAVQRQAVDEIGAAIAATQKAVQRRLVARSRPGLGTPALQDDWMLNILAGFSW